jgi:hypothetical protein
MSATIFPNSLNQVDVHKLSSVCPSLNDVSVVENAKNLELLSIKCKQIASVAFVRSLPRIQNVYVEKTQIADEDIPDFVRVIK